MRRLALGGLALLLLGALAFVALRIGPLAATRVTVTRVLEGRLSPALFGIGTVEARRSWMVSPTVAGQPVLRLMDPASLWRRWRLGR